MIATAGDIIVARALMAISDAGDALEDWMEGDGEFSL